MREEERLQEDKSRDNDSYCTPGLEYMNTQRNKTQYRDVLSAIGAKTNSCEARIAKHMCLYKQTHRPREEQRET